MPHPSAREVIAGVDIGGTNVRFAVAPAAEPLAIVARHAIETPAGAGPERAISQIADGLRRCLADAGLDQRALRTVGCASPGIIRHAAGVVQFAGNLKGWTDVPLTSMLGAHIGAPVFLENDVNAAALAEFHYGAGAGSRSLAYLTISTGVAAGIVVEGTLLRGFHHAAGELGFLVPDPNLIGAEWDVSRCLEQTAGGIGLARLWAEHRNEPGGAYSAVDVFEAADAGHPEATAMVRRAADYLALAVVAIGAVVDPEVLVLGGSIARHQRSVTERIRSVTAAALPFPPRILDEYFGGDGPLLGALSLAAERSPLHAAGVAPAQGS